MVSGKKMVLALLLLGAGLILGYDLVRRSATPETAALVEDRGAAAGTFDRTYRFRDTRYRIRQQPAESAGGTSAIVIAELAPQGAEVAPLLHPIRGALIDVHFLELVRGGAPTVVAIVGEDGVAARAAAIAIRVGPPPWSAAPLRPLPEELERRYLGQDRYERQGAFLYLTIRISPLQPEDAPVSTRLFYDFENERWVVSR